MRDDLSDQRSIIPSNNRGMAAAKNQPSAMDDEDAFWYQNDSTAGKSKQSPIQHQSSKLPNQVQLKRAPQNQDRVDEDMNFYGVSVKTNNQATFKNPANRNGPGAK